MVWGLGHGVWGLGLESWDLCEGQVAGLLGLVVGV